MKIRGVLVVGLLGALALAGCGRGGSDASASSASAPTNGTASSSGAASSPAVTPNVAFLTYSLNGYGQAQEAGLKDGGANVTSFSSDFDPQKQVQQCTDAVASKRYDALVLSALDPSSGTQCADAAKAANIPLFVIDIPIGDDMFAMGPVVPGTTATIIGSPKTNGEEMAELVKNACAGKDPCNVITSVASDPDPVYEYGNDLISKIPGVKIVANVPTQFDPSVVSKALPDVLTAHPDVNVLMMTDDASAIAAAQAVDKAGLKGKVAIIGLGGSKDGIAAVKSGVLAGTQANYPFTVGQQVAEWAATVKSGGTIQEKSLDAFKMGDLTIITKENVDQFTPQW